MPKQPNAQAGPSSRGKIVKVIPKTSDMVQKSGASKAKGKERGVFGDLDKLVSETRKLPKALLVEQFAKVRSANAKTATGVDAQTRALEILAFQNAIKSAASQGSTRVFQSLPRHLRRRAASHNPRRVPKRLRSRAAAEIDPGDNIAKIHRKRAKLRAKGNLRKESRTAQLQRRQINKAWLPTHMYHAKRFHMINLWGFRVALTPTLKSFRPAWRASKRKCIVSDTSYFGTIELEGGRADIVKVLERMTGGPFAGGRYETGARIAETTLYRPNAFPLGMIGPAEIMWCPVDEGDRKVWIRLHPSIFTEVFDCIKDSIAKYAGSSTGVRLRDKRDDLGSFEVVGPKGGKLLRRILRICRDEPGLKKQFFASLEDPSAIPVGAVAGFRVYDPRLHFPPPALPEQLFSTISPPLQRSALVEPSPELASSGLWDEETCEEIINPTFKKSDLDKRRHDLALPGTRLRPLAQDDRIPVLCIAKQNTFTLTFPRGWAQPLLHSVVYTATKLGGLVERRAQHREAGVPCFPEHFGNVCDAGKDFEASTAKEDERRWSRKPPGKRIDHPTWTPDWDRVLRLDEEESMSAKGVWLFPSGLAGYADKAEGAANAFRKARGMTPLPGGFAASAVVHVRLEVEGRGSPGRMAEIHALGNAERAEWIGAVDKGPDRLHDGVSHAQLLGEQELREGSLAGYTNTGNFSMSRGCGFALGTVTLASWIEAKQVADHRGDGRAVLFKVRNNGGRICRLARVELV